MKWMTNLRRRKVNYEMSEMENFEKLKRAVLDEYPRMDLDSTFKFSCHPKVSCFNQCCRDVNIFLTPYDVLRMKKRLASRPPSS